jgi:short-subunit dehydrogenase
MTIGQEHLKLNSAARRGYDLLPVARNGEHMDDLAKELAADTRRKVEILAADLGNSNDLIGVERILHDDSRVALLVNNAGVGTIAPLLNSDVADMNLTITLIGGLTEVVK